MQQRSSLLAELARDLEREAESLKLRAHLLSHRAPPPKSEEATAAEANPALREAMAELEAQNKELVKTKRELDEKQKELAATRDELEAVFAGVGLGEGADDELRKAREAVKAAQEAIETAYEKFEDIRKLDSAARAFAEELDVLAEMALSLRQRCDTLLREKRAWRPPRRRFHRLRAIWEPTSSG